MLRFLGALLLSLWLAAAASAQTFVQKSGNQSTTAVTTLTTTFTAITSGNLVVGSAGWTASGNCSSGGITASVKDNNNVAATVLDTITDATNGGCVQTFYYPNVTNGATSLTVTLSASDSFVSIVMQEWSGIATTSPVDGHTGNVPTSGTTVTSAAITTTVNGDLIYGAIFMENNGNPVTGANSPFTVRNNETSIPSADESAVQTTAGSISATFNITGGNGGPMAVAAFKASGGAGPTCPMTRALLGVGC